MGNWSFNYILDKVEYILRDYWLDNAKVDDLSPEARELYLGLVNPKVKPIKLSLFIKDYKDSDNPDDDFSVDNKQLIDFIRHDYHQFLTARLAIQLAKYYCIKHIETCRLFLCYLELITDLEHRALRDSPKELLDYHILDKLLELNAYNDDKHAPQLAVFMSSIANKITKEYYSEIQVSLPTFRLPSCYAEHQN